MKTKTFKVNKIARDKDVQNMLCDRMSVKTKELHSHQQKIHYFNAKIVEEAQEVASSLNHEETLEELADCLEVIHGYAKALGVSFEEINQVRKRKLEVRGSFSTGTVIECITLPCDHRDIDKFMSQSDKYPEVV